ncbi:unnamed protein product [Sphagnum jensenii]|uniref:CASP-like protein n=1 Tax=Sphagnum jensenii TaxID=128206 RepID=A0ABP0W1M7_9BRYO
MTDPTAPGVENFFRSSSPDEENDEREKSTLPGTAADQEDAYDQHGTHAELQVGMQTTATTGNVADASTHLRLTKAVESQGKEQEDSAGYGETVGRTVSALGKSLTTVGASSLGLRLAESVCSLVALVVMSSNLKSSGKASLKFNSFSSYIYLVSMNAIVFVYSSLQFVQIAYTVISGISFIPSILITTWVTFCVDQVLAYLMMSASSSAATFSIISHNGEMGVHLCSYYGLHSFCSQADAAVAMSFFAFTAMSLSTILSGYRLLVLLKE